LNILFNYINASTYTLSSLENSIINSRNYISTHTINYAKKLDSYISNQKSKSKNKTKIDLSLSLINEEHERITFKPDLKISLKLPNTQKKLKFVLYENNKNKNHKGDISLNIKKKKNTFKISSKAYLGLKLTPSIEPFIRLNANIKYNYYKNNIVKFDNDLIYYSKQKLINTSNFDININLIRGIILSNNNQFIWKEKDSQKYLINNLQLTHQIDFKNYLYYTISKEVNNEDNTKCINKNYTISFKYKHYLKKWMYYEITPSIIFYRKYNYKATNQLLLKFNILFGR